MARQAGLFVAGCKCPFCGNEDKVKGFKVGDKHGWWSVCYADHSAYQPELPEPEHFSDSDGLWFLWQSPTVALLEGPTTHKLIKCTLS